MSSTGLLSYRFITDIYCAEFDGSIFQFPLLYPIYRYSRYALEIVIFVCLFVDWVLIFVNPIIMQGESLCPVNNRYALHSRFERARLRPYVHLVCVSCTQNLKCNVWGTAQLFFSNLTDHLHNYCLG